MSVILTLNTGSSSIKFSVWNRDPFAPLAKGKTARLGHEAATLIFTAAGETSETALGLTDHRSAMDRILEALEPVLNGAEISGIGHRVVHGGVHRGAPELLNENELHVLEELVPLAPLHLPHSLTAIRAAMAAFPNVPQVACFDTAFHRSRPFVHDTYALPRRFYEEGVRRYGFHGLSYEYITGRLRHEEPDLLAGRVVIAHLGNGASACALKGGASVSTTMGFSALDGMAMGTRCGQLDPGVVLYLLDQGYDTAELTNLLYKESGLKALSDLSHDLRVLLASDASEAAQALDYYVARIRREIAALAADLGGLDGLIFCGGVGENAAPIRAQVAEGLGWIGVEIDPAANAKSAKELGTGTVRVLVMPTNEEQVIAEAVVGAL